MASQTFETTVTPNHIPNSEAQKNNIEQPIPSRQPLMTSERHQQFTSMVQEKLDREEDPTTILEHIASMELPFSHISQDEIAKAERSPNTELGEGSEQILEKYIDPMTLLQEQLSLAQQRQHEVTLALIGALNPQKEKKEETEIQGNLWLFMTNLILLFMQAVAKDERPAIR